MCLNFNYVINSVVELQFDIKRFLPIVSSIVFLLTNLHCYLTHYQMFDCVAVILFL